MAETSVSASPFTQRTAWTRNLQTPLRSFLQTETGGAAVLLAGAVAGLLWANIDHASYERVWTTTLSITVGDAGISQSLQGWINTGLMAFFFFVIGLEARREFDLGELRDRRRVTLPVVAGLGGMLVPILIYLAFNAGKSSAHGWGAAMSTDTAFALGLLALVGSSFPTRLRAYLLTVSVVDDVTALLVIAIAYSENVSVGPLLAGIGFFGCILLVRAANIHFGPVYFLFGTAVWVSFYKAGVDPVVAGLMGGVIALAYPAQRTDLERATDLVRLFREQPTGDLQRSARSALRAAVSPNERLQALWHPWTSYVIVPLFALANAGVQLSGSFLGKAFSSPVTLGILFGYVVGKPIGIFGSTWVATRLSRGRLRPSVGWASVAGGGTIAGIGFTVSILIATLAFDHVELDEAKVGVLTAALVAASLTWLLSTATKKLPRKARIRALLGTPDLIVDLAEPFDPERDHVRGPVEAPVTVVEYGDFECPYCGQAEPVVRELLRDFGDVTYVWRHLPLNDVHPNAQQAAEAAEAAAEQGAFWEMHDLLLDHQDALGFDDLLGYAEQLGLDVARFEEDLRTRAGARRVAEDVDSADLSGVSGTPTFFINGIRHYGAYDIATLSGAVKTARARELVRPSA
ncbi:MAG TPA: Na+/H+ antiporter NhaA [Gaiellaceae bacterium]|jgi:Na+/H+ antiporter NhaA|nr:Na+/H+ antiporter NhaA [Gaiellaceae bacterium]